MKAAELVKGDIVDLQLFYERRRALVLGEGCGLLIGVVLGGAGDKHVLFLHDMQRGFMYAKDDVELLVRA